uniref:helix-turn-helix domain-containing protein n=1 Tax=Pseudophaeobacter flagellatus TaxID=2899119 RepID=UPI0038CD1D5F
MAHRELNLRERRAIEDMLNAAIPVREIAAEIGRHVSTIYRDIKRNGHIIRAGPAAWCSRQIGPSMNGLTTLIPARRLANGRVI